MRFYDTYFLDSKMALDVALKKNRVLAPNNQVDGMQICYYDGDKLEEAPYNCIWVPFPTIIDYFSTTINRLPQVFDSTCNSLEYRSVLDFEVEFSNNMEVVQKILQEKKEQLHSEIRNLKPDFQDDKLRFFCLRM